MIALVWVLVLIGGVAVFAASAAIPAVQGALVDLLDVSNADALVKLLVKIDPERSIGRLAQVAA